MPFHGVLPQRASIFRPQPKRDVGVNDAHAWRLNPTYRQVYDKLWITREQDIPAAPVGVDPRDLGLGSDERVFVKPITNLHGVALGARAVPVNDVPVQAGCFWSPLLTGVHTSSDCLIRDGEVLWFAHAQGSQACHDHRNLYWEIGVSLPERHPRLMERVAQWLPGYTGLCNLEMIGDTVIEVHLRGSNGFFDFYGPDFIRAWTTLVDEGDWNDPGPIPGGCVLSLFGVGRLPEKAVDQARAAGVEIQHDDHTPGRIALLRCRDKTLGVSALEYLREAVIAGSGHGENP